MHLYVVWDSYTETLAQLLGCSDLTMNTDTPAFMGFPLVTNNKGVYIYFLSRCDIKWRSHLHLEKQVQEAKPRHLANLHPASTSGFSEPGGYHVL